MYKTDNIKKKHYKVLIYLYPFFVYFKLLSSKNFNRHYQFEKNFNIVFVRTTTIDE